MNGPGADLDPFGTTTDASAYVSRPACEEALSALLGALAEGLRLVALTGPSGIGKTQLLRVLETRLDPPHELVVLPYAGLEFQDLCFYALGLLGEEAATATAAEDLLAAARRRAAGGGYLLLALDDASGLPKETARDLISLVEKAEGALRVLVVPVDDPRAGRVLAALGKDLPEVRLHQAMNEEETCQYVRARLGRRPPPPEIFGRFNDGALRWLHRESGGNPREVHHLSLMIQRGLVDEAADTFERRDQWLEIEVGDVPTIETQDDSSEAPAILQEPQPILIHPMPATPPQIAPEMRPPPESASASLGRRLLRSKALKVGGVGLAVLLLGFWWESTAQRSIADPGPRLESAIPEAPTPSELGAAPEQALDPTTPTEALDRPEEQLGGLDEDFSPESMDGVVRDLLGEGAESETAEQAPEPASRAFLGESGGIAPTPSADELEEVAVIPAASEAARDSEPAAGDEAGFASPVELAEETEAPAAPPAALSAPGSLVEINVNAMPWARVQINGRDVGSTPLAGIPVEEGVQRFRLTFPDGHILEAERHVSPSNRHFVFGE